MAQGKREWPGHLTSRKRARARRSRQTGRYATDEYSLFPLPPVTALLLLPRVQLRCSTMAVATCLSVTVGKTARELRDEGNALYKKGDLAKGPSRELYPRHSTH